MADVTVMFRIDDRVLAGLKATAKSEGVDLADLVRDALTRDLDRRAGASQPTQTQSGFAARFIRHGRRISA